MNTEFTVCVHCGSLIGLAAGMAWDEARQRLSGPLVLKCSGCDNMAPIEILADYFMQHRSVTVLKKQRKSKAIRGRSRQSPS